MDGMGPYPSGRHPDRDNPNFCRVPLSRFFESLGISRNTAKSLFRRGVFPESWLEVSPRGKWFVYLEKDWNRPASGGRLSEARRSLARWTVIRRRPEAARSLPQLGAVENLAFEILSLKQSGSPLCARNLDTIVSHLGSEEGAKRFADIVGALTASIGDAEEKEREARLLLYQKLIEFKSRFPMAASPTTKELAELLHCSVASLYRPPFGKSALTLAKEFIARLWERDEAVAGKPEGEPEGDAPDSESDFSDETTRREIEGKAGAGEGYTLITPRRYRRSALDDKDRDQKAREDNERRKSERTGSLAWEFSPNSGGVLFLSVLPHRALAILHEYQHGTSARSPETRFYYRKRKPFATTRRPTTRAYERAMAQIEERKERLGCIFRENDRFLRRLFVGRAEDEVFERLEDAVADLCHHLDPILSGYRLAVPPDWEALEREGMALWSA